MLDPRARQKVYDNYSLNDYAYSDIEVVIAKLTELLAEGYTHLKVFGVCGDSYGDVELNFNAVRVRLENDEEYTNRTKLKEAMRRSRQDELEMLKNQALDLLDKAEDPRWDINDFSIVRKALEALYGKHTHQGC